MHTYKSFVRQIMNESLPAICSYYWENKKIFQNLNKPIPKEIPVLCISKGIYFRNKKASYSNQPLTH